MSSIASMTGFARAEGSVENIAWAWELRSVNGRTLELRFRLPNGVVVDFSDCVPRNIETLRCGAPGAPLYC